MGGIRSAGRQIRDDFRHATGQQRYTGSDLDNYNTRSQRSFEANERFRNRDRNRGGGSSSQQTDDQAPDMTDQYAENLRRYNEYMEGQQPRSSGKGGPATMPQTITPEMRQAALQTFESQRGAGQVPYYMAAAAGSQNPDMSPAFQYAAQNYGTLGGSQRLAPRPMEMMSVAERRQINDMAQAMADQAAQEQVAQNQYQQGMDTVMRGSGKGGPATMPQQRMPQMVRPPQPMPQQSPFAAMLASRFGGMG
jgi:hypothetical protein